MIRIVRIGSNDLFLQQGQHMDRRMGIGGSAIDVT